MSSFYPLSGLITGSSTNEAVAPCGLRGCKNRPAPFPGRMSCKATEPSLSISYISMLYIVLLLIRAPFVVDMEVCLMSPDYCHLILLLFFNIYLIIDLAARNV